MWKLWSNSFFVPCAFTNNRSSDGDIILLCRGCRWKFCHWCYFHRALGKFVICKNCWNVKIWPMFSSSVAEIVISLRISEFFVGQGKLGSLFRLKCLKSIYFFCLFCFHFIKRLFVHWCEALLKWLEDRACLVAYWCLYKTEFIQHSVQLSLIIMVCKGHSYSLLRNICIPETYSLKFT